jgi:putative hydrolase of the HAD superfamily
MIIVFDLSGVVFNDGRTEARARIHQATGISAELLDRTLLGPGSMAYRIGEVPCDEFWDGLRKELGYEDIGKVRDIFFDSYRPDPQVIYILGMIRSTGARIGFISNSPEDRMAYLEEKYRFRDHFDFGVCSYDAHAWKPDPAIFKYLLEKYRLDPKEILYIDDQESNLAPAESLGIQTMHFTGIPLLMVALKRLGVK